MRKESIIEFIKTNWSNISDLLMILVGLSAVWIYKAQEKNKIKDAALLIVLQIDDLQTRVQEIQSERFWTIYNNKRSLFSNITDGNSLTTYTPMQISATLQAVL